MVHPDNGTLLALQDGEVSETEAEEIREHLATCSSCRAEADALAGASRALAEALELLDSEPDTATARAKVARRFDEHLPAPDKVVSPLPPGSPRRERFGSFLTLPRAASIALLLTGVTVSALPGSPVRRWLTDMVQGPGASEREGSELGAPLAPVEEMQEDLGPGAGIPAVDGSVEIWIHDLPDDSELRVRWTDGEEAWIFAGQETRFNLQDGKLEAFSPVGPVVVEIPRGLSRVVVGLDGRVLLQKSGEEIEILGPIQERTPFEILFEAPGAPAPSPGDPNETDA
jgi:hypothetical protein